MVLLSEMSLMFMLQLNPVPLLFSNRSYRKEYLLRTLQQWSVISIEEDRINNSQKLCEWRPQIEFSEDIA